MRTFATTIICCGLLLAPAAVLADGAYPGEYAGKAKGASVSVTVNADVKASVAYSVKSECGRTSGRIALGGMRNGAFGGKRVSKGPKGTLRTTLVKLRGANGGETLAAKITDSLRGGDSPLDGCKATRKVSAKLGKTEALVPTRDAGHYAGASADGHAISFDLVEDTGGKARIENMAVDVLADCIDGRDEREVEFPFTVRLTGISGSVKSDGTVEIFQSIGEDVENEIYGEVGGGAATLDVAVLGLYGLDGLLTPLGLFECESWGEEYAATRQ